MSSAPKKVGYVINDLLMGGAQRVVVSLAKKLNKDKYQPIVYCLNKYPDSRPTFESELRHYDISVRWISDSKTSIKTAIPKLIHFLKEDQPDLIHTHLVDATIAGVLAARVLKIKAIVIHEHQTHTAYSWKVRAVYKLLRRLASVTICYSPIVEKELFGSCKDINLSPNVPIEHTTIKNGIDIRDLKATVANSGGKHFVRDSLDIPRNAFVISSVARLVPWKGQLLLLESFARLTQSVPNAYLCFVGEGPLRTALLERTKSLGLEKNVLFLGARTDAPAIVAASDVMALTLLYEKGSEGESIGLAGMEAMALGIPLVASEYSTADSRIRSGQNAVLVEPHNTHALSQALLWLAKDETARLRIGLEGYKTAQESMDWISIVSKYENIYDYLIV